MSIIGKIVRIAKKDRAQDYDHMHNGLTPDSYIQILLLSMIACTDNCLRNKPGGTSNRFLHASHDQMAMHTPTFLNISYTGEGSYA